MSFSEATDRVLSLGRLQCGCHFVKFHMGGLLCVCNKNPRCNKRRKKIYKSLNFIGCKALKELLLTKRIKIAESQRSTPTETC